LFQEAGGDVTKVVMSHLESKFDDFLILIWIVYKLLQLYMHIPKIFWVTHCRDFINMNFHKMWDCN
jgi:hypothetical protein